MIIENSGTCYMAIFVECRERRILRMASNRVFCVLAIFLAITLPLMTSSCAKKVVQKEEGVVPGEAVPMEQPGAEGAGGGPSEATLTEEQAFRNEAQTFADQDIHFDFDRYDLTATARELLADKAYFLKKYPSLNILIEGHCDERGTNEYNLALGERRANAAKQYLMSLGITESRIATMSYGEERPLDPGHNEAAWAKNRRDHFEIVSK
jgi:peptidoglycan-associated lipoprotein